MIKDYANKVMDYEYNAFMTLMNVSVSKHLFGGHFTVLWTNDYFYELIGYSVEEYELLFHNHVDEYYRDDPEVVALMTKNPNVNGYEVTRRIRTLPREDVQNVPIIAMTADAFSEDVEAAKKAGMNSHLAKPFTANSLNREILKVL